MKYCLLAIMIFPLLNSAVPDFNRNTDKAFFFTASQLGPIYFFYTVPSRIRLSDKVDLSFSKSTLITAYRYRLEVPGGMESKIDKNIILWSSWKTEDFSKIIIPDLDVPGTYKFIIEYSTGPGTLTKRFEKYFEVYSVTETAGNIVSRPKTTQPSSEPSTKSGDLSRINAKTQDSPEGRTISNTKTLTLNQESRSSTKPEVKNGTGTLVTENAARPQSPKPSDKPAASISTAERPVVNNKTKTSGSLKRDTPKIEKLNLLTSDIELIALNKEINVKEPVSNNSKVSEKDKIIVKNDPVPSAKKPISISKLIVKKPAESIIGFYQINQREELVAYNPPPIRTYELLIDEEQQDSHVNLPVIDKIHVTKDFSLITDNDSLVASRILVSEKNDSLQETLFSADETLNEISYNQIDKNDILIKVPGPEENISALDYNDLLLKAIDRNDSVLFRKAVLNGGGNGLSGSNGGNIFHLLNGTLADEYTVFLLKKNGNSIDMQDENGNSPLHTAILNGDNEYAKCLINQGANLNVKNKLDLSPLHLTTFLNNYYISDYLMVKGATIDIKGNSGYTPLHIASELNNLAMVKQLLSHGAKIKEKTDQKLTPVSIAKIQNNYEIIRLFKGSGNVANKKVSSVYNGNTNYHVLDPRIKFNLAFDDELAKRRHLYNLFQIVTPTLGLISSSAALYMKSKANNYYSLSKIAETEGEARALYNKTKRFDSLTYIAGGVSLISVYGFIHSTVKKKNATAKMYKTLK